MLVRKKQGSTKTVCLHATMKLHDVDHEERQSQHYASLNSVQRFGMLQEANLVTLSL